MNQCNFTMILEHCLVKPFDEEGDEERIKGEDLKQTYTVLLLACLGICLFLLL